MRKSRSTDQTDSQDKHYKTTLLLVKLVASLSSEVSDLRSVVKEQNALIKSLLPADIPLEEEPV